MRVEVKEVETSGTDATRLWGAPITDLDDVDVLHVCSGFVPRVGLLLDFNLTSRYSKGRVLLLATQSDECLREATGTVTSIAPHF